MAALGRKTGDTPLAAGPVPADPFQEESRDPWRVVGPKGRTVTFEGDEPGGDWPLSFGNIEHVSETISPTPVHNKYEHIDEHEHGDNEGQPAQSSSSPSSWLKVDSSFDSYEEQAMRELEAFRDELDAQEARREAILQANGIEAKRIRAAQRRKERLYGEAIRDSSAFKAELAERHAAAAAKKKEKENEKKITSTSSSSAAHHYEAWELNSMAAQQAIAGARSARQGAHGPEGPGFTRLPMV